MIQPTPSGGIPPRQLHHCSQGTQKHATQWQKRPKTIKNPKAKQTQEKLDLEFKHRHENQVASKMRCLSIPSKYCTITPRISDKPNSIINQMAFVFSSICSNTSLYPLVIYRSGKSLYFPLVNNLSMGHVHPFSIANYSSLDLREYPLLNIANSGK